ncbi:MAG: HD domain-containing protein [Methylocystaceae bacterium]
MKRIEILMKDPLYLEYLGKNTAIEEKHVFCKYDLQHMIDVARIIYILILEHNDLDFFISEAGLSGRLAAKEVIYAAGLLHDIAKWQEYETGTDHAALGSRLARNLLQKCLFNDNEISVVAHAIYEHRNVTRDMSFLGEKVHRADNLSRFCYECSERNDCTKYKKRETGTDYLVY